MLPGRTRPAPSSESVLLVDDDPIFCEVVGEWLAGVGYAVEVFHDAESCLDGLTGTLPRAICLDLNLPGIGGMDALRRIKANHQHLPVIILTADDSIDKAVTAMQLGAYDYLVKPLERERLLTTVSNAVQRHQMAVRLSQLEREVDGAGYPGIIGSSSAMRHVFMQLDRVAPSDTTVLIWGESGTGKELVAQAIHRRSGRRDGPFVPFNCAAIPESLLESELFGHEKGAFTGATARRIGKFEQADRGTLFLDEVAELSLPLQAKLLRAVQQRSFERVGGGRELKSDFRMVAATHRDLTLEVKAGRFREDLYYRLAVFELELPPLRARQEDLPQLVAHFIERYRGDRPVEVSADLMDTLRAHSWPGNVRELENAIQRALVVCGPELLAAHLPLRLLRGVEGTTKDRPATAGAAAGQPAATGAVAALEPAATEPVGAAEPAATAPIVPLAQLEREAIERAYRQTGGRIGQMVERLQISRSTLYRKLKQYNIRQD